VPYSKLLCLILVSNRQADRPINMNTDNLFEAIVGAFGGRRLYAHIWSMIMLVGTSIIYLLDFRASESVGAKSIVAFILIVGILIAELSFVCWCFASPSRRLSLLAVNKNLPSPLPLVRIGIWVIPILICLAIVISFALGMF